MPETNLEDYTNLPIVVNKREEEFDVYIGRGSNWGNPYPISDTVDRWTSVELYEAFLEASIKEGTITLEDFKNLSNKRLGCFCKPELCHGDIIVKYYIKLIINGEDLTG